MTAAVLSALLLSAGPSWAFFKRSAPKTAPAPAAPVVLDPLEPLTTGEIDAAAAALRSSGLFTDSAVYLSISLQEPSKDEPAPEKRHAFAVVYDRQRRETSEAAVDVQAGKLESWRLVPGVEPGLSAAELASARSLILADGRWKQAMEARGRQTSDDVEADGRTPGPFDSARSSPHRAARLDFYVPSQGSRRLIEGLQALVDLTDGKVVELDDTGGPALPAPAAPPPPAPAPRPQKAKKPASVPPPAPPPLPFSRNGHELAWRGWRLRYALTPREGLALDRVGREDGKRGVLNRASVSESLIVYGDPQAQWQRRTLFQEAELGLGRQAMPLEPGVDAPSGAAFFDEPVLGSDGRGGFLPRAVAAYERDGGEEGSRRGRELVLESKSAEGPESYLTQWIFGEDGELDAAVEVAEGGSRPPLHQHFFNFRLDFDVDGSTNSVVETEVVASRPPAGPTLALRSTPLEARDQARRDVDSAASRRWLVTPSSGPAAAASGGYWLVPESNEPSLFSAGSPLRKLAPFIDHQVWLTVYRPDELYAAGDYPGRRARASGVERWTERDEPLRDQDLVLWYTVGAAHLPTPAGSASRPLPCRVRLVPSGR